MWEEYNPNLSWEHRMLPSPVIITNASLSNDADGTSTRASTFLNTQREGPHEPKLLPQHLIMTLESYHLKDVSVENFQYARGGTESRQGTSRTAPPGRNMCVTHI